MGVLGAMFPAFFESDFESECDSESECESCSGDMKVLCVFFECSSAAKGVSYLRNWARERCPHDRFAVISIFNTQCRL